MKWISVKDRLPEKDNEVLVFYKEKFVTVGEYTGWDSDKWRVLNGFGIIEGTDYTNDITHWRTKPKPPKN